MTPLALKLRPQRLSEIIGQDHIIKIFGQMVQRQKFQHILLWGPPGTGKTTIAYAFANEINGNFRKLDATNSGVKELRQVIQYAKKQQNITILAIDEIHRWSKNVQDVLLLAVEENIIILIGLTVETAKFAVNKALLSRCLILETKPLGNQSLILLIKRIKEHYKDTKPIKMDRDTAKKLILRANGDARKILLVMETLVEIMSNDGVIIDSDLDLVMPDKNLFFDARGNERYNYAHCYQESIQHSDADAAIYWLAQWLSSGEDPAYICRRMLITAFEDCAGNPFAITTAMAACYTTEKTGLPECIIPMAQATCEMAMSKRNKASYYAIKEAMDDVKNNATIHVPEGLRAGTSGYVAAIKKKYVKGWEKDG